jgi:hypothetical protein
LEVSGTVFGLPLSETLSETLSRCCLSGNSEVKPFSDRQSFRQKGLGPVIKMSNSDQEEVNLNNQAGSGASAEAARAAMVIAWFG